jgi:hypothetical protein
LLKPNIGFTKSKEHKNLTSGLSYFIFSRIAPRINCDFDLSSSRILSINFLYQVSVTKKQILSCIFSEKVHFENGKAATPKYTPPIVVLINARGVLEGSKNNKEVYKDLLCTLAPPPGLEPGTP